MAKQQQIARLEERITAKDDIAKMRYDHALSEIAHVKELLLITQASAKEALTKAEASTQIHFASVNEFNDRMKEVVHNQASTERVEGVEKRFEDRNKNQDGRIAALELKRAEVSGESAGHEQTTGFWMKWIAIIVSIMILGFAFLTYLTKL